MSEVQRNNINTFNFKHNGRVHSMNKYLMVLALLAVDLSDGQLSLSTYPCYKPTKSRRLARIVGGLDAPATPYIAALMRHGGVFCGSAIVSELYLVTAGHCVCNNHNKVLKPTQFKAYLGLEKVSQTKSKDDNTLNKDYAEALVDQIILHPEYVCGKPENDIALLKLQTKIQFNEKIRPLCVNSKSDLRQVTGIVSGWGWTNENFEIGQKPDNLQRALVPVWDNLECQASYKGQGLKNNISSSQLCAGFKEGKIDSCWADSGSPLIDLILGTLIGIVSTGVGCGKANLPGIYTRVSDFNDFISNNVSG